MGQNRQFRLFTRGSRIAGGTAAIIGGFWLAAWFGGWAERWSAAGTIIIKTNMALCLLFGGIALLMLGPSSPTRLRRAGGAVLALFILLIGALTLSEHIFQYNLGVDQLLAVEPPGAAATASPNRMGPPGSACLVLLGTGLLALALGRRRLVPYLGLAVCAVNFVPAVGFLYGVAEFYSLPHATGIAWPTVVSLLALGGGLVLSQREGSRLGLLLRDDAGGALIRRLLPAVILIPLALGYLRVHIQSRGFVTTAGGTGLFVIIMILLISFFLWRAAEALSRSAAAEAEALRTAHAHDAERKQILELTPIMFVRCTRDLRYRYVSHSYARLVGYPPENIPGQPISKILGDAAFRKIRPYLEKVLLGETVQYEAELPLEKGGVHFLSFGYIPEKDERGQVVGFIGSMVDISERKQAEEALRESEEKYRDLVEGANSIIIRVDRDGRILFFNEFAQKFFGYSLDEVVGRDVRLLLPAVESESGRDLVKMVDNILESPDDFVENTNENVRKNGERVWVSWRNKAIKNAKGETVGNLAIGQDITERKKAEALVQALAEQERLRLGAAVEQASEAVVMVDLDGKIRYVNAAFEAINRTRRDQALGGSYWEILADEALVGAIRESVRRGEAWHGHVVRPVSGGRPVELEVTVSPATDLSGKVTGALITEKDVTIENALQQQVRQAQKMEALGTLAGGVTHDFNNILGTIVLNTEMALLDLDPSHPARWPLPLVLQAANRGKELVKQIITFSRQRAWERKPLEIAPIVTEGIKFLRSTLPKDVSIQETIDAGCGVVLADPSHIHQVLVNLCQNAALAMAGRPGPIELKLAPVEVDSELATRHPDLKPGPYVRLTVSDNGCGMSPEVMERIFEPFFTTRKHGEGSGLGLAVVHGIIKSYEGAVTVTSEPGLGSTFNVYIPRIEREALTQAAAAPLQTAKGRERILLVEDEEAQRISMTSGLERLGYKVTAKADGRAALTAFRRKPAGFDLVITDQIMPKMSGLELAEALVKVRPDMPVILCTGFSEKVNGGTAGQSGIREVVMKPFTLQEITRAIRRALKESGTVD